jgi:O-antigen/teichoic acid export membrane protein
MPARRPSRSSAVSDMKTAEPRKGEPNGGLSQAPCATPDDAVPEGDDGLHRVTRGTARMATVASLRNILQTGLMAVTAAVVARFLGATDFGLYAGGTAAFNLAWAFTDLGFSMVVAREMARRPEEQGRLLRATLGIQVIWSVVIALGLFALAVCTGGIRGQVMLVLSPAVALAGLGASRQIFAVRYHAAPLLITDLSLAVLQASSMILLAVVHAGVVPIAAVLSASICLTGVVCTLLARREVEMQAPLTGERVKILRMAVPLGLASVLASLYFTIDQVILTWLVPARELGQYAAAVRMLSVVVMIPGFVMAAGIPGLAQRADDRAALSRFASVLVHWLAVTALPACIGLAVFARPAIHFVFGPSYDQSATLLRILMLAGALSLVSNVLGIILSSLSIVRPQLIFNLISLAVNVAGNIVLVPRYGVAASAWLTVVCEGIVVSYAIIALWPRLSYRVLLRRLWRPLAAVALASCVGLALGADGVGAIGVSVAIFLAAMVAMRAWPSDLLPARLHGRLTR